MYSSYIQDAVLKFITDMVEASEYCSHVMKKHFNKKLLMTKEDDENFESSTKCWICDFVEGDVKVRDYWHVTWKHKGLAQRDFNINNCLNYKIPIVFLNLKNYDAHLTMQ